MKKPIMAFKRKLTSEEISKNRILFDDGTGIKPYEESYINCEAEIECNNKKYCGGVEFSGVLNSFAFVYIPVIPDLTSDDGIKTNVTPQNIFKENHISEGDIIEIEVTNFNLINMRLAINILKINR